MLCSTPNVHLQPYIWKGKKGGKMRGIYEQENFLTLVVRGVDLFNLFLIFLVEQHCHGAVILTLVSF